MRNGKIHRYQHERKRRKQRRIFGTLGFAVLLIAAAAAGWFLFDPISAWVEQISSGRGTSQLPESSGADPVGNSSDSLVSSGDTQSENSQPVSDDPEGENRPQVVVYLPTSALQQNLSAQLAELKAQGATGVVFDLKDSSGEVLYQSAVPQVNLNHAQKENAYNLEQTVRIIKDAGMTPIGRMHVFRDRMAALYMEQASVKYMDSGINWLDDSAANGGKPWLSPPSETAQQYLLSLIQEAAAAGVEELFLDSMQFPEGYSLQMANYGVEGTVNKSAVLAAFLTKAAAAVEEYDCMVRPVIDLKSACGLSNVRYGDDLGKIFAASEGAVLYAEPSQFGAGVNTEALVLTAPLLDPGAALRTAMQAAEQTLPSEYDYFAWVQAYTVVGLDESVNKTYGAAEIQAQMTALAEFGIENFFLYHPQGEYPLSSLS